MRLAMCKRSKWPWPLWTMPSKAKPKPLREKLRHPWPHLPQRLLKLVSKLQPKLLQMRPLTHRQKLMKHHLTQCQLTQHQPSRPRPPSLHVLWWPCAAMTVLAKRNLCLHPQVDLAIAATAKRVAALSEVIVVTALSEQTAARV